MGKQAHWSLVDAYASVVTQTTDAIRWCLWLQQQLGTGGGGRKFFYYLFLYHDVSCNITQQLIKNKTDTLSSTRT